MKTIKEYKFRLEFNEEQQKFHCDNYTHEENTKGWFTVMSECTDIEYLMFDSFLNIKKQNKLTKEILTNAKEDFKQFLYNIYKDGLEVNFKNK